MPEKNEAPRAYARGYQSAASYARHPSGEDHSSTGSRQRYSGARFSRGSFMRAHSASAQRGEESGSASSEPKRALSIDFAVGGQALIEGIMIKSPSFVTVAVRKKNGSIKVKNDLFRSLTVKYKFLKIPILRGIINMVEMIVIGMKALNFSAQEYAEDMEETGKKPADKDIAKEKKRWFEIATFAFSIAISLALAVFLFKFIPLAITEWLRKIFPLIAKYTLLFNLIDGVIRIAIFLLYVFALSVTKSFCRIFQYHGAEHKTVFAYEKGKTLTYENIKPESPRHPRCGTSFIMIVLLLSILILSFVPRHPVFAIYFLRRLAVLPIIAGISYELLKWSAKHKHRSFVKILTYPGLITQYLTTKEPDSSQIEVAIKALNTAVELEKNSGFTQTKPN